MRFCIRKKFFVCLNCEGIADCPFAGETEDADNTQFFPSTAAAGRSVVERGATSPNLPGDRSRRAGLTSALGTVGRQRVVGHYLAAGSASAQAHARPPRFRSAGLAGRGIGDVGADSSNKIGSLRLSPHKRGITDSDGLD